ncbi:helix-turn-helix domain-containing protein [Kutzneria kofuensis]|jgi:DNA-binding CsgD family transcriptional regulator|nr:helix-turn-helix transcriptional regulator [Kutzneria kofuensis]
MGIRWRDTEITSLSAVECQVAALAALGHTDQRIADQLAIAVRAVEACLAAVYRKLDVRSSRDLAYKFHLSGGFAPYS